MTAPGIGPLTVLAYVSTVEEPERFGSSRAVGAHFGLTPRQYQSGEVDRSGRISRCGDGLARTLMFEAAVVILTRVKRLSGLEGLGAGYRPPIRCRQGACCARPQAHRHPSQHLALGRAVSLVSASHPSVMSDPTAQNAIRREDALRGEGAADCVASRWEGL